MANKKPIEVVTPPNMLKVKVGGPLPQHDEAAIARAESAMQELSGQFDDWIRDEIDLLESALAAVQAGSIAGKAGDLLFRRAHDLKGMGSTYEFPLVSRLAGSLCALIEEPEGRAHAQLALVAAHVGAMKASVRDGIRDESHPVGAMLAEELETRVANALKAAA